MQIGEIVHVVLGMLYQDRCPFCSDKKDSETYITYKGEANDSKMLRKIMNKPNLLTTEQKNARPKDGKDDHQAVDDPKKSPDPIFEDSVTMIPGLKGIIGKYGDEAHHAISGNECMKGEDIEKIIKNEDGTFEKNTGYSINNCANGVYLPSWNRTRWGQGTPDGAWGSLADNTKFEIMKLAMIAGAGQAHIASHEGKTTQKHPKSYPKHVKKELEEIRQRALLMMRECPLCSENGQPKRPAPTPYGVNQWLDGLSRRIIGHLKSHPRSWKYFVSDYAARYHNEICRHGTVAQVLPDAWPPL